MHAVTSGPILQPFSMCDPAVSTDTHTVSTTEDGLDQQQLPEQSSSRAEAADNAKASGHQEPEDHTPIVAPSAESIRQGIMEARCQAYIPGPQMLHVYLLLLGTLGFVSMPSSCLKIYS